MNLWFLLVVLSCGTQSEKMPVKSNNYLSTPAGEFKEHQLTFERVREAYQQKFDGVADNLAEKGLDVGSFELYIRAFKEEQELELWARSSDSEYQLVEVFNICQSSGKLGPKRKQGDYQVPEGYYHIDRFNPKSNFHLSLGINYPNFSDKILGEKGRLGGDIFIHGNCVTVGCLPMTDDIMKTIYVYAIEAINGGQERVSITFFPSKMTVNNYKKITEGNVENKHLYAALKKGYDYFEQTRELPRISFNPDGSMIVK